MQCPKCAADTEEAAAFCHHCGADLREYNEGDISADPRPDPKSKPEPSPADDAVSMFKNKLERRRHEDDDHEEDLWEGRYSPRAMIGTWVLAVFAAVVLVSIGIFASFSLNVWLICGGLLAVMFIGLYLLQLYRQYSVKYRLTDQRFIHEKGLLSRQIDRIEVIDMDDITFKQGPIERILNVGTILITSSDRTDPEITLPGIEDVRSVSTTLDEARRHERRRRGIHIEAV